MLILFLLLGYALIFIVYVVIRLSLYRDIGDYPAAAIDKSTLLTTIIRPSTRPSSSGARTPPSSGPQPGHHHPALVRHHHPALNQATIIGRLYAIVVLSTSTSARSRYQPRRPATCCYRIEAGRLVSVGEC